MIAFTQEDHVWASFTVSGPERTVERNWLKELLSYPAVFYTPGQYASERNDYKKSIVGKDNMIGAGLRQRVLKAATNDGVQVDWPEYGPEGAAYPVLPPHVQGFELRPDQVRLLESVANTWRGVLESPTGTGKTVLEMGVLSMWPESRVLVLMHSADIRSQTIKEFRQHGFDAGKLGEDCRITVSTRQALVEKARNDAGDDLGFNLVKEQHVELLHGLGVVIVDECHLWGGLDGQYATILNNTNAPVRLGMTGTLPKGGEQRLALEAALGPVVGRVTYDEAKGADLLAPVELRLVAVPYRAQINQERGYDAIRRAGLVENRQRNALIVQEAQAQVKAGGRVLVFVEEVDHVDALLDLADVLGLPMEWVDGSKKGKLRDSLLEDMKAGRISCAVSTKVWREGINIPGLTGVILAQGGKAELSVLQAIGRGLRTAPGKDKAVVVDFLDPYHHLAQHTVQRLGVYLQKGWL